MGGVPPSINVGQMNARFHLSKMSTGYGCAGGGSLMLDANNNDNHNILEGVINSNNGVISTELPNLVPSSNLTTTITTPPSKRTLSSLYWNTDDDLAGTSSKRLSLDNNENGGGSGGGGVTAGNSFASLLNQLPQTPSMVGSIGDGLFRPQYQIPGMHWYA